MLAGNFMTKMIISPGFGSGFIGEFEHRFDPVLVDCLEKLSSIPSGAKHKDKRGELQNLIIARFYQFNINVGKEYINEIGLVDIPAGKRFSIEEYDGSEYVITEDDLEHVAP